MPRDWPTGVRDRAIKCPKFKWKLSSFAERSEKALRDFCSRSYNTYLTFLKASISSTSLFWDFSILLTLTDSSNAFWAKGFVAATLINFSPWEIIRSFVYVLKDFVKSSIISLNYDSRLFNFFLWYCIVSSSSITAASKLFWFIIRRASFIFSRYLSRSAFCSIYCSVRVTWFLFERRLGFWLCCFSFLSSLMRLFIISVCVLPSFCVRRVSIFDFLRWVSARSSKVRSASGS